MWGNLALPGSYHFDGTSRPKLSQERKDTSAIPRCPFYIFDEDVPQGDIGKRIVTG
jgi:hypothetical protein